MFTEQRDFWWNSDLLDLMARRWRLKDVCSLAEIGCVVGRWLRLLYPQLRPGERLVGLDREPRWVAEASQRNRQAFPNVALDLVVFKQAEACHLPLAEASFEAVTRQTVLMHLAPRGPPCGKCAVFCVQEDV